MSKPTSPCEPSQMKQVGPDSHVLLDLLQQMLLWPVPLSTLVRSLSVTLHPNLAHLCPMYDLKSLRATPILRISL